ncbi:MAG: MFS transporter [Chloroflexota bacterium]|nr:MFS transporter [Chloroflexota bacterium]
MQSTQPTAQAKHPQQPEHRSIDGKMVWLLAVATAFAVGNLYYGQPLLADIARSFSVSVNSVGIAATVTQLGYAVGLLLIVPLGDAFERRKLIVITLLAVTVALIATALAPSIPWLIFACFAIGVTTVVPQIILPMAASLTHPRERGRVVGTIMSGLLIGILLARTVSGFIGAQFGWRAMYWIAAGMMLLLALALRFTLPTNRPQTQMSYPQLLHSLAGLLRTEPSIREISLFGALVFGAFSAFWSTLAFFLSTPPYHYGSEVVGLFGLVGVGGALIASFVGRLSDRIDARYITGGAIVVTLLAFIIFWLLGHLLWGLILGVIVLDMGTQGNQVSNQARVYSLNPEARNRLNTIYMVSYFIGGSLGTALGTYGWSMARWTGVCIVGSAMLMVAIIVYLWNWRRVRRGAPVSNALNRA